MNKDQFLWNASLVDEQTLVMIRERVNRQPEPDNDTSFYIFARHWFPVCVEELIKQRQHTRTLQKQLEQSTYLVSTMGEKMGMKENFLGREIDQDGELK